MKLAGIRKDGSRHTFVNGKWEPPITVPAYLHERILRNLNENRRKEAEGERVNEKLTQKKTVGKQ